MPPRVPVPAIRFAGSRVLREVARPVAQPADTATLGPLIENLRRCLVAHKARGISAPQLGVSLRLFLIAEKPGPLVVLNPVVLCSSAEHMLEWETCLSVPDYAALVRRPSVVDVEFETLAGARERRALAGDSARVFQHELDHLDGILYTERMFAPSFANVRTLRSSTSRADIEALGRQHTSLPQGADDE